MRKWGQEIIELLGGKVVAYDAADKVFRVAAAAPPPQACYATTVDLNTTWFSKADLRPVDFRRSSMPNERVSSFQVTGMLRRRHGCAAR